VSRPTESMLGAPEGVPETSELLARIEAALHRSEAAAERLGQRHRGLRSVALDTVGTLDRLIEAEKQKANG
jgi:hypothetical protein